MKDNVVVITGASKGIGAELARQLAAKGAKLVLAARSLAQLEAVAAQCRASSGPFRSTMGQSLKRCLPL